MAPGRRHAKAGHEVTLCSRTRKGAAGLADTDVRVASTVAAAVNQAQVAITLFSNDAAEEAVTFYPGGLLDNQPSSAIHPCMSTISVEASRRLAAASSAPAPSPWPSEVQDAVDNILFVQIQPRILVNPNAVKEIKPLFGGRARVLLAGGTVFTAGREACRTLTFLLN